MSVLGRLIKTGAFVLRMTFFASGNGLPGEKYSIVDSISALVEGHL